MVFVDTHCHLNYRAYRGDLEKVIQRAAEHGVYRIIVPGLDIATSREAVDLSEQFESVFAAVGVHPGEVESFTDDQVSDFFELSHHPKVVAIGEIGLDSYHHVDNKEKQLFVLKAMLELSFKADLPVILHSRESLVDLVQTIKEWKSKHDDFPMSGIFHSFEGTLRESYEVTSLGFLIGAGGPVTYKNAHTKHELLSKINLQHIVLETDGPFLPPQQYRGKRNEPGYIPLIAERIALLQESTIESVAEITTRNAQILFKWID